MPHDRMTELSDLVEKGGGLERVSKTLIDNPQHAGRISEAEFSALIAAQAKLDFPTLKGDQAFSAFFCHPDNALVRKAHALIKSAPFPGVE